MISSKLLHLALDNVKTSNPVAEFAENLFHQGVTEEDLQMALKGRNDAIAVELVKCHKDAVRGVASVNQYGVVRTNRIKSTRLNHANAVVAKHTRLVPPK